MSFSFAWPWLFLLLPLPVLVFWLLPAAEKQPGLALRIPMLAAFASDEEQQKNSVQRLRNFRLILVIMAWLLLVTAAARPQQIGPPLDLPQQGRNLMLAVDISGSMERDDMVLGQYQVSRLTGVKAVAGDFIERREGDRLGLILFGQQAFLQVPLTFDRNTVRTLLNEAVIGLAGKETAIGDAIAQAVKRLREQPEGNRVLILLTDGANSAGSIAPLKAAELAQAEGVRIYTIGIGGEGGRRSIMGMSFSTGSDLDEATLQGIADKTGGQFFRARDLAALQEIYQLLDEYEPVDQESSVYREVDELYVWPLLFSALLTVLVALMTSGLFRPDFFRRQQPEIPPVRPPENV